MVTGTAFLTKAGNLKAKFIIHLSIPVWAGVYNFVFLDKIYQKKGDQNELGLLENCFIEGLILQ